MHTQVILSYSVPFRGAYAVVFDPAGTGRGNGGAGSAGEKIPSLLLCAGFCSDHEFRCIRGDYCPMS